MGITANTEVRMQKALINSQSELKLQIQRQADTTADLRDQVRKQGVRMRKQGHLHDDDELEATIAEMVQNEVQQRLDAVQSEQALASNDASEQEATLQIDPDETRKIIDYSIQFAIDVICKTITDEVRQMAPIADQPKAQQSPVNDDTNTNGDDVTMYDEYQLERRMQEAWRRTYLEESSSVSHGAASRTDQTQCSRTLLASQSADSRTEFEPLR
ncbi:hypothetical protein PHYPSEUDO_014933 [Phytophthora pseudosyringae]|uniref:Uncharacterized protein n=1 Tax=Phytophthora pseudosyringae TaxID=221518 RepID=A0A8T1W4V7_9STRA|nr:hypothetical protein PHYPSEUDO_014933 [Phytophthora pseudosyringae]